MFKKNLSIVLGGKIPILSVGALLNKTPQPVGWEAFIAPWYHNGGVHSIL